MQQYGILFVWLLGLPDHTNKTLGDVAKLASLNNGMLGLHSCSCMQHLVLVYAFSLCIVLFMRFTFSLVMHLVMHSLVWGGVLCIWGDLCI